MIASQLIGKEIDGYQILEVIGRGGMGVVLKAEDVSLGRVVAIKLIDPVYAADETFMRRFRREARALARFKNSHIVTIHALRRTDAGLLIVMEHVDGGTLSQHFGEGPVPWQQLRPVLEQALSALDHAHGVGVVHRDIKPGNIMLTRSGEVKVMDFGIAKILSNEPSATMTQGTIGTPYYMSPEQLAGSRDVDGRSDLYSLAMTAYRLLAGRLPFNEDSNLLHIYRAIAEEALPSPRTFNPGIPEGVAALIGKTLSKDPAERFQTAEAMLAALSEAEPVRVVVPPQPPSAPSSEDDETLVVAPPQAKGSSSGGAIAPPIPEATEDAGAHRPPRRQWSILGAVAVLIGLGVLGWAVQRSGGDEVATGAEVSLLASPVEPNGGGVEGMASEGTGNETPPDSPAESVLLPPGEADDQPPGAESEDDSQEAGAEGLLVIRSDPSGARVRIDGRGRGTTPARLPLPPGSYRVEVERDGYAPNEVTLRVAEGRTNDKTLTLAALVGTLGVTVRPWGRVFIDGTLRQQQVSALHRFELPAGAHMLRVEHPEFGRWERSVTVPAGGTESVSVNLLREVSLTVTAFDSAAQPLFGDIYVDGVPTGKQTPRALSIRVGQRQIEVRAEGYVPSRRRIDAGAPGQPNPLRLTLEKVDR